MLGLVPVLGDPPAGAATNNPVSSTATIKESSAATTSTTAVLTLGQWKATYDRDIGILADDVLVVVDDGKRAQTHLTKAKVKTTLNDCRQWVTDAGLARTAAPPIPMAAAERAWTSMISASAQAAADCVASLQRKSLSRAKDFQKRLSIVENDEAMLDSDLNG